MIRNFIVVSMVYFLFAIVLLATSVVLYARGAFQDSEERRLVILNTRVFGKYLEEYADTHGKYPIGIESRALDSLFVRNPTERLMIFPGGAATDNPFTTGGNVLYYNCDSTLQECWLTTGRGWSTHYRLR